MHIQCPFDPAVYKNAPMGMFHCPICGEMQLAGIEHLPFEIDIEQDEYEEVLAYNEELRNAVKEKYES